MNMATYLSCTQNILYHLEIIIVIQSVEIHESTGFISVMHVNEPVKSLLIPQIINKGHIFPKLKFILTFHKKIPQDHLFKSFDLMYFHVYNQT